MEKQISDYIMNTDDDTIFLNRIFDVVREFDGTDKWMGIYDKYRSLLYTGEATREEIIRNVDGIKGEIERNRK